MEFKAIIAGGGVQGTTLALRLLKAGFRLNEILIVDPSSEPLATFRERLHDCQTLFLRSSCFDHVDHSRESLVQFAEMNRRTAKGFVTDRRRPCAKLFVDHARFVADQIALSRAWKTAYITGFQREGPNLIQVATTAGTFVTQNFFLSLGMMEPDYPSFASCLRGHDARIQHVFDLNYEVGELPAGERVAVIGGGITAAQVACSIAAQNRHVSLICRRKLSPGEGTTSSDDWLDPSRRAKLTVLPWQERFAVLRKEGDRGTVPIWEMERVTKACDAGQIDLQVSRVAQLIPTRTAVEIAFPDGRVKTVDAVVMATGLKKALYDWVAESGQEMKLPTDASGLPILGDSLEWGKGSGIFLMGHLAGPVVGPFAANISGGVIAAQLIVDHLTRSVLSKAG